MILHPNAADASENSGRERPALPVRKAAARLEAEPRAAAWRPRPSARISVAQLLRAGLLLLMCCLCVAFMLIGSAKAGEAATCERAFSGGRIGSAF